MAITATVLTRAAAVAAVAAGVVFIGVNVNHPHLDATTVATTEVVVRSWFKVVMAALALTGITGMYLSQIRRNGVLGLVGYATFGVGYLLIMSTSLIAAAVLPSLVATDPAYVGDVLAVFTGGTAAGDIGALQVVFQVQSVGYLAGGLLFGIALFRARVLIRWATVLLAASGLISAALGLMPDFLYRLLAFPNAVAMIALGVSLWRYTRRHDIAPTSDPADPARHTTASAQ